MAHARHIHSRLARVRALTQWPTDSGVCARPLLCSACLLLCTFAAGCHLLPPTLSISVPACPLDPQFISNKPAPSPGAGWSSGDGRRVPMKGTTGSFTQPNLRQYGPFPDFLKRSCDL